MSRLFVCAHYLIGAFRVIEYWLCPFVTLRGSVVFTKVGMINFVEVSLKLVCWVTSFYQGFMKDLSRQNIIKSHSNIAKLLVFVSSFILLFSNISLKICSINILGLLVFLSRSMFLGVAYKDCQNSSYFQGCFTA